jgi:hypothetical protein
MDSYYLTIKSVGMIALACCFQTSVQAQETIEVKYSKPSVLCVAGGANFNFYRGSTQQMNASFTSPKHFMMDLLDFSLHRF